MNAVTTVTKSIALCIALAFALSSSAQSFEAVEFELQSGETISAERGVILVPENRSNPDARMIPIRFLRFKSRTEQPASPIIYLAGGPGGSGTGAARGERWAMFDRLRDVADVIILDQRGTGMSNSLPDNACSEMIPADSPATRDVTTRVYRAAMMKCLEYWKDQGVDIRGYTTWESAADIEAVREALGVERVNLLGISYGTHLALATLKRYPERIDRLVLASAEGLDQTVKRPALTEAYFKRLQAAVDSDPIAAELYPDVRSLINDVLDQVEADPPMITVHQQRASDCFERPLSRFDIQIVASYRITDPREVALLLEACTDVAKDKYRIFAYFLGAHESVRGMPEAMDIASGISAERLSLVEAQAKSALLGDALNYPMPHLRDAIPGIDLGDDFRSPVTSDRPALFFSGTLDGRTYPEAHAEIAEGFSNGAIVTIENAGHNLFFSHPEVVEIITEFFSGVPAQAQTLVAPLPSFVLD